MLSFANGDCPREKLFCLHVQGAQAPDQDDPRDRPCRAALAVNAQYQRKVNGLLPAPPQKLRGAVERVRARVQPPVLADVPSRALDLLAHGEEGREVGGQIFCRPPRSPPYRRQWLAGRRT